MKRILFTFATLFVLVCGVTTLPSVLAESADSAQITLNGQTFDPLLDPPIGDGSRVVSADGKRLHLIQLDDNLTDALYADLHPDVQIIQYVPNRAFIVYASDADLNRTGRNAAVRWAGEFPTSLRVSDDLQPSVSEMAVYETQMIDDGAMDGLIRQIESVGGQVLLRDVASTVSGVSAEYWRVELPSDQTDILFNAPTLIFANPYVEPTINDEGSNLVAAGQISGNAPTGNYQEWLDTHGYDGSGVKVAIVDTGVDWDHPDLNVVSGTEYGGYNESGEPGSDSSNIAGHGTHVAGTVAGDGGTGTADGNGFIYGQGTAPAATLHAQDFLEYRAYEDSFQNGAGTIANGGRFSVVSGTGWSNFIYGNVPIGTWLYSFPANATSRLATSSIDLSGYDSSVSLALRMNIGYTMDAGDCFDVKTSADGGNTWLSQSGNTCGTSKAQGVVTYSLTPAQYVNNFQIAIDMVSDANASSSDRFDFNDVNIRVVRSGPSQPQLIRDSLDSGSALSNNSWSVLNQAQTDDYTLDAIKDNGTRDDPFLVVFAAGNAGGSCGSGPCFDTIGNDAKNALVVGAGQVRNDPNTNNGSFLNPSSIAGFSSRGITMTVPANQMYMKPDVVAPGQWIISTEQTDSNFDQDCTTSPGNSAIHAYCQGTSMASPHVAGIAAQFTQMWRERTGRSDNPSPALVKAAIINSADDMVGGDDGWGNTLGNRPDVHQGWGRVNSDRLLNPPVPVQWYENTRTLLSVGEVSRQYIYVSDSSEPLRITLAWLDPKGTAGSSPLVNNLDLVVTDLSNNTEYHGNIFNNGWSVPNGGSDASNPVENVFIQFPTAGEYEIEVFATALNGDGVISHIDPTDSQFSLVCYNCVGDSFYVDDSANNALVGHWTFDEGSGTTAHDWSSRGNHLTLNGGAFNSSVPAGKPETGNYFSYKGSSASRSNVNFDFDDGFTVSLDTRRPDGCCYSTYTVFQHGGLRLFWDDALRLNVTINGQTAGTPFLPSVVNTTDWFHITVTLAPDGTYRFYSNGFNHFTDDFGNTTPSAGSTLTINQSEQGYVDNVRVYERALDFVEVQRLKDGKLCETTGVTWHDAFQNLQCALHEVNGATSYTDIDQIKVAEGVYKPGMNRSASFIFDKDELEIRGGYAGTSDDLQYPRAFPTILSGDIDEDDAVTFPQNLNSYHVTKVSADLGMDGFTIEGGIADNEGTSGGGMIISDSAEVVLLRTNFYRNFAELNGGAIEVVPGSALVVYLSRFVTNRVNGSGGSIVAINADLFVIGSEFSYNFATSGSGGAIVVQGVGNEAPLISDSTFNAVLAQFGNAVWTNNDQLVIQDSIIWNSGVGGFHVSGVATINSSIYEGGWTGTGSGNSSSNPNFIDPDGTDNIHGSLDDNLRLSASSPAIDAGVSCQGKFVIGDAYIDGDADGTETCDQGAYEFGTLLVVDDDDNSPDFRSDMVAALLAQDLFFEWWDTAGGTGAEPNVAELAAHNQALWFTGNHSTTSDVVGPTASAETNLQNWLNGGNRCFMLDSLDYLYSRGNTPFATDYLGLDSYTEDQRYTSLTGAGLFDTLAYPLNEGRLSRTTFGWFDLLTPNATASTLFNSELGSVAISKQTSDYRTAFLGFSLGSVSVGRPYSADARGEILATFFDNCDPSIVPTAVVVSGQSTVSSQQWAVIVFTVIGLLAATVLIGRKRTV